MLFLHRKKAGLKMPNEQFIIIPWKLERLGPNEEENQIKSPEGLFRYILKNHSKQGDKIFDPFAGLGTSMFVAEEMKRVPFGIESDPEKYEWVAGQLENWTHMICDDAAKIDKYNLPKMDLVVTCPPYMGAHTKWNPLYNGDPEKAGYDSYIKRMGFIFKKVKTIMKNNASLIIQLDNIKTGKKFTPLIHDIRQILTPDFKQYDEKIIKWDNPKQDYPYTNLLYFKKK